MAASLAAAAVALLVVGLALASLNGNAIENSSVGFSIPFVSFAIVGAIIVWKRPANTIGWLLSIGSLAILMYGASEEYARYGLVTRPGALPGSALVSWLRMPLWVPAAAVTIVYLPLLFPTGDTPSPRWRWIKWVATIVATALMVMQWAAAWSHRGTVLLDPDEAWVANSALAGAVEYVFPLLLLCGIASISSLVVRFRRAGRTERLQIEWVLYSLALFLVALIGDMIAPFETGPWPFAAVVLIAISFLVSILRFRLYEIDRIVSRTVSYVLVAAILAAVYVGGVLGLSSIARAITGESGDVVVAMSTLLVAALFQPVRGKVQAIVDRRFNRSRYDAQRTLGAFGRELRDELDLAALERRLRLVVAENLAPNTVTVWAPAVRS